MAPKKVIDIPDAMMQLPAQVKAKRQEEKKKQATRNKKEAEQKRVRDALLKKAQERERRIALPYARKIFAWARAMHESEIGQELIEIGDRGGKGFCFFDGKPPGEKQMWLGIDERGLWREGFG